jgi:hypothetical protein
MPTERRRDWDRDNPVRYLRLPRSLETRLVDIAARERRSLTAQMVWMLEQQAARLEERAS